MKVRAARMLPFCKYLHVGAAQHGGAGCVARLFTTATEVGDSLVAAGFALALVLNLVLGAQLWLYWGDKGVVDEFPLRQVSQQQKEKEGKSLKSSEAWTMDSGTSALDIKYSKKGTVREWDVGKADF